jgi:GT2 family glycosyltransferase
MIRAAVLNFNGGDAVLRSLRELVDSELDRSLDVVAVDNGSTDGSADRIAAELSEVRLLREGRNRGYPALNRAFTDLDGVELVAVVNPDAHVDRRCLAELAAALDADRALGAACPRILLEGEHREIVFEVAGPPRRRLDLVDLDLDGAPARWHLAGPGVRRRWNGGVTWAVGDRSRARVVAAEGAAVRMRLRAPEPTDVVLRSGDRVVHASVGRHTTDVVAAAGGVAQHIVQNAGSVIGPHGLGINRGYHEPDGPRFDQPVDVPAWCGAAVMLRADYLRELGGFDDRWFLYYEDLDLSWRGLLRGWRYRYVPTARVWHEHSTSIGHGSALYDRQHERNRLLTITKDGPWRAAAGSWGHSVRLVGWQARVDIAARVRDRRRPELALTGRRMRAMASAARLVPSVLRTRREVRQYRLRDDAELPILGRWRDPTE